MNSITIHEVISDARNAALIANCGCPSQYRTTKWEPVWRQERNARIKYFVELRDLEREEIKRKEILREKYK